MVDKTKILTSFCPDHSCIELKLEIRTTGYWKFNASLTNDTKYINKLNELLDKWVAEYNYIDDKRVYWDLIKYEIRNLPVSIVPTKGRAKIEKNNYLKND